MTASRAAYLRAAETYIDAKIATFDADDQDRPALLDARFTMDALDRDLEHHGEVAWRWADLLEAQGHASAPRLLLDACAAHNVIEGGITAAPQGVARTSNVLRR